MTARIGKAYLRPASLHVGPEAVRLVAQGHALPIVGGRVACSLFERIDWEPASEPERRWFRPLELAPEDRLLASLQAPRPAPFDAPRLMGILNVTPDSFSDGGAHGDLDAATAYGLRLAAAGADIVDVGGESTRPGAAEVPVAEELRRVLPVVERLAAAGVTVSVDTRHAAVMRAAVSAGASMINDVSGLAHDPASAEAAAASGGWVALMHMRGTPATMNLAPRYRHCALEVHDELASRIKACMAAGIDRRRLIVDPGLCFGKNEPENLDLLANLTLFHGLGCPVMLGASRKGWAVALETGWPARERLPGSLAAAFLALSNGVQLLRVHDVVAHRQLLTAWAALADAGEDQAGART